MRPKFQKSFSSTATTVGNNVDVVLKVTFARQRSVEIHYTIPKITNKAALLEIKGPIENVFDFLKEDRELTYQLRSYDHYVNPITTLTCFNFKHEHGVLIDAQTGDNPERACIVCGCTDNDCRQCIAATGEPCYWVSENLCSRCAADQKNFIIINPNE